MTEGATTGAAGWLRGRARRKLAVIVALGALLIAAAVGVRVWWARGAPARAARAAAAARERAAAAALEEARAAVAASPEDWRAHDRLAASLLAVGREEEALAAWRRGTEAAPQERAAWMALANGYLARRRFAAAEEAYAEVARRWPREAAGFEGLAVVLRHAGRFREALAPARAAVRLSGRRPEPRYVLGTVIQEIGVRSPFPGGRTALLEEGRRSLLEAAKTLRGHPDIDYRRGRICLLVRRYDEARQALEAAVIRTPERTVAWVALSEARMRTGDVEGSIAAARRALATGPLEGEARMALGRALLLKSDHASLENAAAAFREAARLDPANQQARQRLGTALLRLDRVREAGIEFEAAHRLDPNDPYPPQQLAQIYQRIGDGKRAAEAARIAGVLAVNERILSQLQRASANHPENPLIHRALGDRYRELGWLPQAEEEYLAALEIAPNDPRARAGLAAARRRLGERDAP
jgi:tetratricopeptide (TPR) repeat protein